ncbi:MAG: phosphotransferase [Gaiellaceae bacterium]
MHTGKMHADEVDTDASLVRRLLAAQFAQWADLSIEPVRSAGTDNALYRLGDDMVVRLPRRERSTGTLKKERRWLPRLAPFLPLAVPVPLADGMPAEGYPFEWSVYRWLKGENATMERVTDLSRLATDLAQFVAALHQIDPTRGPSPGEHNVFRGEPLARRDAPTRAAIVSLRGAIDAGAVTAAWESALRSREWEHPPVWIHGDLDSRNLLVEEGRLSAVIDFGCLGVGDPACDVMVAWKVLSADTRDIFRAALSVDESTWARARGWVLSQALVALSYYTVETNPVLVLEARRWLAEVLADHVPTSAGSRVADTDPLGPQQLSALAEVGTLLDRSGLEYWLFGGWAVDFHVGAVTREHDDVDLAVWLEDAEAIRELLEAEGWRHVPTGDEDGGIGYELGRVRLELTYLTSDDAGRVFVPLRDQRALWSGESLGNDERDLLGVRSRVLGLALLKHGKSSARDDPGEAAKDRADLQALSSLSP